jgi:hypothetical protein
MYMVINNDFQNISVVEEASIDSLGSKSSSIMFSSVDEDERQKRMESMELSRMNFDVCHTCNDSKAIIFDAENNVAPVELYFVIK